MDRRLSESVEVHDRSNFEHCIVRTLNRNAADEEDYLNSMWSSKVVGRCLVSHRKHDNARHCRPMSCSISALHADAVEIIVRVSVCRDGPSTTIVSLAGNPQQGVGYRWVYESTASVTASRAHCAAAVHAVAADERF